MKKLTTILLAATVAVSFGHTHNFSGINKLKNTWYKLTHHESSLKIQKDCNENIEKVHISERKGKFFLKHHLEHGDIEYEITKCALRPTKNSVEHTLDMELVNIRTKVKNDVIVKYSINQSLWFGLTNNVSTDLFTSEETSHVFEQVSKICK